MNLMNNIWNKLLILNTIRSAIMRAKTLVGIWKIAIFNLFTKPALKVILKREGAIEKQPYLKMHWVQ